MSRTVRTSAVPSSPLSAARARQFRPQLLVLEDRCTPSANAILDWNDVMLRANANDHARAAPEQGGPVLTARAFAIVSLAAYDAYNSVAHIGEAYLTTAPNAAGANADAAVAQAAHDTLAALFPGQRPMFDKELGFSLARIRNGPSETRGRAVGAYVAQQILAVRMDDGAADMATPAYVPNGLPGFHSPDPLHPTQGYYGPNAGNIVVFAVQDAGQFGARRLDDGTPAGRAQFLRSQEYTNAFAEVKALGGDGVTSPTQRTAEQTQIGLFWAYDGRPGLGTPPRLYNQIARTIAAQEGNSEGENARMFALINVAMADAGITSWKDKYDNAFWRPVMGVQGGADDSNSSTVGDASWMPLGAPASNPRPGETNFTPPFPAYTSGHATFGAAFFQVLSRFYGQDNISFQFQSDELNGRTLGANGVARPAVTRTFHSFTEAKIENAQSRIYLGIHWRFDADDGIRTGNGIANYVVDNFLRPSAPLNGFSRGNGPGNSTSDDGGDGATSARASQVTPTPVALTIDDQDATLPSTFPLSGQNVSRSSDLREALGLAGFTKRDDEGRALLQTAMNAETTTLFNGVRVVDATAEWDTFPSGR